MVPRTYLLILAELCKLQIGTGRRLTHFVKKKFNPEIIYIKYRISVTSFLICNTFLRQWREAVLFAKVVLHCMVEMQ